jgi:very-short-patch-repair endonuclease
MKRVVGERSNGARAAGAVEARIWELAALQHGLVTRAQLLDAGLRDGAVKHRRRVGRLLRVQRGVYRVGPLASPHEREMAAVLACGPDAVVSHASAATLWQMLPARRSAPVAVTLRSSDRRRVAGVRAYSAPGLGRDEVGVAERIPATSPARTVLDLAGVVGLRSLEQALARAERNRLATPAEVSALMRRHPRRAGYGALRALLDGDGGFAMTRSKAEDRLLALIERAQLPRPEVNTTVDGHEVDLLWRAERLIVEMDGFAFHSSRPQFEHDRRRDGQLRTRGFHVIRVTWRQMVSEPEAMLVRIGQALTAAWLSPGGAEARPEDRGTSRPRPGLTRRSRHRPARPGARGRAGEG